jgi:putative transposase
MAGHKAYHSQRLANQKRSRQLRARGGVPHRTRPHHKKEHPVHVTMRADKRLPILRKQSVFQAIRRAFPETAREWFRVVHFSVQADHVHMIVEATDKVSLSRGMAGLSIRLARAVNRVAGRRGKVFTERYHARALASPREVRHGLVYVLMNRHKHAAQAVAAGVVGAAPLRGVDPMSSAYWFDGWKVPPRSRDPAVWPIDALVPVQPPRTWLARVAWRRYGLIRETEHPKLT